MNANIEITAAMKGKALENNVKYLFKTAGFETYTNQIMAMYEIDVVVKIGDRTIIIECKNYQNSSLTIRNLIHQWNSKNQIIKADKVILVLAGLNIKTEDYALANEFEIELWDEKYLSDLFKISLNPEELRNHLLGDIKLDKEIDIASLYRREITNLIVNPLLAGKPIDDELIYKNLNHWVRVRARTDLRLSQATIDEINRHIQLFEGTKKKKVWIFNVTRSESDYWVELETRLKSADISYENKNRYLTYMDSLIHEVGYQKSYFTISNNIEKIVRLIRARVESLIYSPSHSCSLGFQERDTVEVTYIGELQYKIALNSITHEVANIISWLLTSEYQVETIELNKRYIWVSSKSNETAEKVFRILDEVFEISDSKRILDFSLDILKNGNRK